MYDHDDAHVTNHHMTDHVMVQNILVPIICEKG